VGASLVTVSDAGMLIEFYTVDGVLRDTYTVGAAPGGNPLFVNGNDVLNGTAAADYLWGLNGNDTLKGLAGNDMLIGGQGDDLFVFSAGSGQDTIADFVPGAGTADRLDLRALGIDTASEFQRAAFDQGADAVLDLGGGNRITFLGVHVQQFHDTDFLA
jgi:Ca2+-binding RTX toxin-like protein